MSLRFDPFPKIETERLLLRKLRLEDTPDIFTLRSDERINQYIDRPLDKAHSESEEFIEFINTGIEENKWLYWGICTPASIKLIGTICLWNFSEDQHIANLGYELHPNFQRRGIMSEAVQAVIHYGFNNLDLHSIEAYTHYANETSKKLLERHRFVLDRKRKDKENKDNVIFVLEKI